MNDIRSFFCKLPMTDTELLFDEPMAAHTTFRIGGKADAFAQPKSETALAALLTAARDAGVDVYVIGGGANLLVADDGVRGLVVCTAMLCRIREEKTSAGIVLSAEAGMSIAKLAEEALARGLSGLEFAAGLPGSVGGAAFMNARCYERQISDAAVRVRYLRADTMDAAETAIDKSLWAYKRTPFMPGGSLAGAIITSADFLMQPGDDGAMQEKMRELKADRVAKGHFDWPSAGSMFKNDRGFGRPTGAILDELGFRGKRIGDAMVSPKHANIFVNAGNASAADMIRLIDEARDAARAAFGFELEPEVVMLGFR